MRLIDADALLERLKSEDIDTYRIFRYRSPDLIYKDFDKITMAITNAPTIQRDENIIEIDKRDLFGFARSAIKDALTTDENMNEAHLWSDATDLTVKLLEKLQIPTVQREGWVSVPIEPTNGMIYAGAETLTSFSPIDAICIYKAMIQAAPTDKE